jgi:hypothetical protein
VSTVGREKYDKLRDRVISVKKSVQGGWKPNMWGNYPQHKLGKVEQIPPIDWMIPPRERRPEVMEREKKRDPFKFDHKVEQRDYEDQRTLY